MTTIEVYFLIVGHTHSSIDQYFSVLSSAIGHSSFIGSPMSLHALFKTAHNKRKAILRPHIVRRLDVYYDYATMFAPYINNHIKVR